MDFSILSSCSSTQVTPHLIVQTTISYPATSNHVHSNLAPPKSCKVVSRGSENSEWYTGHSDRQAKISTGPAEIKLDRNKFGKQIVLKIMRQIFLNCVNDLKNEFLVKF